MTRYAVDQNQSVLLETAHWSGADHISLTDLGGGRPDLLLGCAGVTIVGKNITLQDVQRALADFDVTILDGANILVEVKMIGEDLRENQQEWHDRWPGQAIVLRTRDEIFDLLRSA